MDGGPIVMRIPVRRHRVRVNGQDVDGIIFKDFWRAEYGDGESHTISNPIREWLWSNSVGVPVPNILFVLESGETPDETAATVDPNGITHGDVYNDNGV